MHRHRQDAYRRGVKCHAVGAKTACHFICHWNRNWCQTSTQPESKHILTTWALHYTLYYIQGSTFDLCKINVKQNVRNECSLGQCVNRWCHTVSAGINLYHSRIDVWCTVVALQRQQITTIINVNIHQALLSQCHCCTGNNSVTLILIIVIGHLSLISNVSDPN